jgi:hypothetical protein
LAKERTDKSPYQSRFGAGWISADKYLAENMCSRKGRAEGGELAPFFWKEEYWRKEFLKQLRFAADLLKVYSMESILAALRHNDAKRIYSLGAKSALIPLISKIQKQLDIRKEGETTTVVEPVDVNKPPRKPFGRGISPLQRLRELENGQKKKQC